MPRNGGRRRYRATVADERLTLAEVQTILRHAHLDTTGHYLVARIEDMRDKLQEHYTRPRPQRSYPAGYDPEDINQGELGGRGTREAGTVGRPLPGPRERAAWPHRPQAAHEGAHR
ncbi:MAG: hypothetical protein ACREOE_06225 [Gemmatimonadales bacterium]